MQTIYRRTVKGEEEITKRTYKLNHMHRFVLIMIDGKATVENIVSRSSEQWKPRQSLYEMEKHGFIENINEEFSKETSVSELKLELIQAAKNALPNNYQKTVNKIINADMRKKSLSDAIDSACIFIKLTISEEVSETLKEKLHQILEKSSEV
jgi:hypothetical protein